MNTTLWTHEEAVELCRQIEAICPAFGYHVALTGGLLYKSGTRKDCDVVLYQIRLATPSWVAMCEALAKIGLVCHEDFGFCTKAFFNGKPVDILRPEVPGNHYQQPEIQVPASFMADLNKSSS